MIAYKYDGTTKEYIGTQVCQLDPIESEKQGTNVYLLPANCTFSQPLEPKEGKAVVFNETWVYVNDYRGKPAYNAEHLFTIDYVGDLKAGDHLLTDAQIEGLENGTLIYQDGQIIPKPEPTLKEQIIALERQYNMCRWQREGILAPNSEYSDYTKNKAQQIEDLAEQLR